MVPEGTTNVPIKTLIALMVEEGEDYKDVEIPSDTTPSADTPSDDKAPAKEVEEAPAVSVELGRASLHAGLFEKYFSSCEATSGHTSVRCRFNNSHRSRWNAFERVSAKYSAQPYLP
ncbi:Pyruvate dehydrogenase protein X component [Holothuria leucospilota]|uniref:Pyruvate dehydrogenase protein X component n=1 Tax=Holothuria leucospilota TaxID=206669 RepID=A0A9Q1BFP2_HOLLE|nr:Pyruvate dehydrogenase protein X component [Holothuria leucospilota]